MQSGQPAVSPTESHFLSCTQLWVLAISLGNLREDRGPQNSIITNHQYAARLYQELPFASPPHILTLPRDGDGHRRTVYQTSKHWLLRILSNFPHCNNCLGL